jgi:hypothetical protein
MPGVRFDYEALYHALDERRRSRGMTWQQAAREVGPWISASTLTRTARGGPMEADGALAMIRWLGLRFQDFTRGAPTPAPSPPGGAQGLRFDARAFYSAIDSRRVSRKMTWKEVASQLHDPSPGMLTRLAKGGRMGVDQVVLLSTWLGVAPESLARTGPRDAATRPLDDKKPNRSARPLILDDEVHAVPVRGPDKLRAR